MCEKVIFRFGPVETLDFDKVDAIIYKAWQEGQNFDIEFEDTNDDLESYCDVRAKYLRERKELQALQNEALPSAMVFSMALGASLL